MILIRIDLKIFNSEVVDCSTGFVNVIPDEVSLRILVDMVKTIIEADFIKTIGVFSVQFQGNVGSMVRYECPYVCEDHGFNNKVYESYGITQKDITKQNTTKSRDDKTFGLFVESFEPAKLRKQGDKNVHLVPSGLSGVEEALNVISTILNNERKKYPTHIPLELDTIVYFSFGADIGFVEGTLFMEGLSIDSRRNLISIIFNSDGLPLPEEEYETPVFSFIGKNLDKLLKKHWANIYSLDYVWADDERMYTEADLKAIDLKNKLNTKAFFYDFWYLPVLKKLIRYDIGSNNVIAIYSPRNELWTIVNDLENLPNIDAYGVKFISRDKVNIDKLKVDDLLYGIHLTNTNKTLDNWI